MDFENLTTYLMTTFVLLGLTRVIIVLYREREQLDRKKLMTGILKAGIVYAAFSVCFSIAFDRGAFNGKDFFKDLPPWPEEGITFPWSDDPDPEAISTLPPYIAGMATVRTEHENGNLTLRREPWQAAGNEITKIPNRAEIYVIGTASGPQVIAGKEGEWWEVEYQGKRGFCFSAYLTGYTPLKRSVAAPVSHPQTVH